MRKEGSDKHSSISLETTTEDNVSRLGCSHVTFTISHKSNIRKQSQSKVRGSAEQEGKSKGLYERGDPAQAEGCVLLLLGGQKSNTIHRQDGYRAAGRVNPLVSRLPPSGTLYLLCA